MTPLQAIKINCRFCHGGTKTVPKCQSKHCSFNRKDLSVMERIRRGCQECATDHRPDECNGELVGSQRKILADLLQVPIAAAVCPLLPYRMGKNPNLSSRPQNRSVEHLKPFQKTATQGSLGKKEASVGVSRGNGA